VTLLIERLAHHRVHALVIAVGGAVLAVVVLLRLAGLVRAVESAGRAERLARREAEQARQLLAFQNEQLVELDRLKDEFVSSVSHELRTPLTSIAGYVELLLEEEADDFKRGHLSIIERNADRLLALVSDLLFAARLQYGRLELERSPVDLQLLVLESVDSARPRAQAASVRIEADTETVSIMRGEPAKLAQLLDNLVSNAIKFTPRDGRVDVRLEQRDGTIRLEVSDTGIGIEESEREQLFQRFFRAQSALEHQIQGTGLGLYISKAIVDAHDGRIGVDGQPGQGTTFVVEFPASATCEKLLVLCADDDEDILSLVSLRLERAGFDVATASDGEAAVEIARERRPALAVLDVMMPRRTGYEVLSELRSDEALREIKVILLSARVQESDVARGLEAGADAYLAKPFRAQELVAKVNELLDGGSRV
jgi:signal transduction histidine kinase